MSWWKIAWRSIQQRGLASVLTSLSMALGVMLVVMVLTIHGVVADSFKTGSSVGYNLLIGAKGGSTQLVLNTVFYLSKPIETIPYDYYLDFSNRETREMQMRYSAAFQAEVCLNQSLDMQQQLSLAIPGASAFCLMDEVATSQRNEYMLSQMYIQDDGFHEFYAQMVIPVCLGDTYGKDGRFRVIATTPAFFNDLEINVDTGAHLKFLEGRPFEQWNTENGVFEAVVGRQVAEDENLKIGDAIRPIHGDLASGGHEHKTEFKLVGILERSGTRNDSGVFVNMEGFFLMNDHIKPIKDELSKVVRNNKDTKKAPKIDDDNFDAALDQLQAERQSEKSATQELSADLNKGDSDNSSQDPVTSQDQVTIAEAEPDGKGSVYLTPLPIEQRELTALLLRGNDDTGAAIMPLENAINSTKNVFTDCIKWSPFRNDLLQTSAQAVNPMNEVYSLLELFVNPIQRVLLALTIMICIVSGISILVSIYNSMSERKQEIAIMRALGADQTTVMGVILAESILLSFIGGAVGWLAAHLTMGIAAPYIQESAGVHINPLSFAPAIPIPGVPGVQLSPELLLVPGLMLLAIIVGLMPAISAYRTDVSENLS